jgi:flagellar motor switch protein FliG
LADVLLPKYFADYILKLDDRSLQRILREIDMADVSMSLKGENETVQEKIFRNMSKRAAEMIKEEMEFMGPVKFKNVKNAQNKVLLVLRELQYTGEIDDVDDVDGELLKD